MKNSLVILLVLALALAIASCTAATQDMGLDASQPARQASDYGWTNSGSPASKDNARVGVEFTSNNNYDGVRVAANLPIDEVELYFEDGSSKDFDVLAGNSGFFPYDDFSPDNGRSHGRGKGYGHGGKKGASGLLSTTVNVVNTLVSPTVSVVIVTLRDGSKWYFDRYGKLVPCDAKWYTDTD